MRRFPALALLFFAIAWLGAPALARTLTVAPATALPTPSAAAKIAKDGDTVLITAADYEGDVAVWRQNDLTLKGVGGRPHLIAAGKIASGKAIWVITGANVRVENIAFSGARAADLNGAGIRSEGVDLTIVACYFHGNQMGILSNRVPASTITIENSEFAANTVAPNPQGKIGHNVYIGEVKALSITGSRIHGAEIGHNVKSRAARTVLRDNDIFDGPGGRSSYLIDLPAGGVAIIDGNRLHRGATPENTVLLSYGAEKLLYTDNRLIVTANSFRNDYRRGIFIDNRTKSPAEISGNSFAGPGTLLRGPGTVRASR